MKLESTAVVEGNDRVVVLELEHVGSRPIVLEGTAFTIWNEIDGSSDTDAIVLRLSDDLGFPPDQIRPDVERFLTRLQKEHLIASTSSLPVARERQSA